MLVKRPIYNQQLTCVAFDILADETCLKRQDAHQLLTELISNTDTQLPVFIPFDYQSIIEQKGLLLENPIILKLNAKDIESKYSLEDLNESRFSIALLIDRPEQLAWLNFAEYIGLTEQYIVMAELSNVVKYSREKNCKLLAYGISKPSCFDQCKALKMDYYCGDFLFVPIAHDEADIASNKLNLLQLIQSLQSSDCNFNEISQLIKNDPLLSFQLLKIANSVGFSRYQKIESIDQAIAKLGINNLKNWVMVLSMKNISDKPIEIIESGLIRANMALELAQQISNIGIQSAYMAGLLSIIDSLLNKPMDELINQITLSDELKEALILRKGPIGEILSVVVAYEEGRWNEMNQSEFHGLNLSKLYIDCLGIVTKGIKAI